MKPPIKAMARRLTGPGARNSKATESNSLNGLRQLPPLGGSFQALIQERNAMRFARFNRSRKDILREIALLREKQASPAGQLFWDLEQAISRLTDELERRAS